MDLMHEIAHGAEAQLDLQYRANFPPSNLSNGTIIQILGNSCQQWPNMKNCDFLPFHKKFISSHEPGYTK